MAIWTEVWHSETSFAMILGLPSTFPSPTPSPDELPHPSQEGVSSGCDSPLHMLNHRMCSLAVSVVARSLCAQPSDFTRSLSPSYIANLK